MELELSIRRGHHRLPMMLLILHEHFRYALTARKLVGHPCDLLTAAVQRGRGTSKLRSAASRARSCSGSRRGWCSGSMMLPGWQSRSGKSTRGP